MYTKLPVLIIKVAFFVLLAVITVAGIHLFLMSRENAHLVELYAEPNGVVEEEIFSTDSVEDQAAATSRAKWRRQKSTTSAVPTAAAPTPGAQTATATPTTTTTIKTTPTTTTVKTAPTTAVASAPATTQNIVSGIAAGYMLATLNETQLRNYFAEMNKLGLSWVRFDIDWSGVQRNGSTTYSWTEIDRIVKIAGENNVKMLAIIAYAPKWAAKDGCVSGQKCAPKNPAEFAAFATAVATRYKNGIAAYEIWNEPNLDYFWSPKANGTEYTAFLKAGYAAIKTVDPKALVITGGLSPVTSSRTTIDPLVYLKDMYAAGGKGSFDAIAHHPYTYILSPSSTLPWNHWYQLYKIYDLMNQNGDGGKRVWITEIGAPTGGSGTVRELGSLTFNYGSDYLSQKAQAETMSAVIAESAKIAHWVGPVFWYSLIDLNSTSGDPEGHFGLITSDNKYKAAHNTLLNTR